MTSQAVKPPVDSDDYQGVFLDEAAPEVSEAVAHCARLAVCAAATDVAEARIMLQMLGLIPDDPRPPSPPRVTPARERRQCTATAVASGQRCRAAPAAGDALCVSHQ